MRWMNTTLAAFAILMLAGSTAMAQGTDGGTDGNGGDGADRPQRPHDGARGERVMGKIDADGDGVVSKDEARRFAREAAARHAQGQGNRPQRPDRPEGTDRPQRPQRPEGSDRPQRPDRPEGTDRPQRPQRPEGADRPQRPDRPARPEGTDRPDRPQRPEGAEGNRPHPFDRIFNAADKDQSGSLEGSEIREFVQLLHKLLSNGRPNGGNGQRPNDGGGEKF